MGNGKGHVNENISSFWDLWRDAVLESVVLETVRLNGYVQPETSGPGPFSFDLGLGSVSQQIREKIKLSAI